VCSSVHDVALSFHCYIVIELIGVDGAVLTLHLCGSMDTEARIVTVGCVGKFCSSVNPEPC